MLQLLPYFEYKDNSFSFIESKIVDYKRCLLELIHNGDIKLVIFDLDNTLWNGVLGEGSAEPDEEKIYLVKQLVGAGVMCSIASYNQYEVTKEYLQTLGIWDYFIFPQISTQGSKSSMIKNILAKTNLQAKHTIFTDDEPRNLAEAKMGIPPLMILYPHLLFCLDASAIKANNNTRLQEYKILELKDESKANYSSHEAFLEVSQIQVFVSFNCEPYKSRIMELISRTNQLNFTKQSVTTEELDVLLNSENMQNGVLCVVDKYGNYGICGFFSLDKSNHTLVHFLFSCRVLGMNVESAILKFLNNPSLEIKPPVAINEFCTATSYISIEVLDALPLGDKLDKKDAKKTYNVILKGGCLFSAMLPSLEKDSDLSYCFFDNFGPLIRKGHSSRIARKHQVSQELKMKFPILFDEDDILQEGKCIVLSLAEDFWQIQWSIKDLGLIFLLGTRDKPITVEDLHMILPEDREWLSNNANSIGLITAEQLLVNLQTILLQLHQRSTLVLVNFRNPVTADSDYTTTRLTTLNAAIDEFVETQDDRVFLFDLRKYIKEADLLTEGSLFHYKKQTSVFLATELDALVQKLIKRTK